MLPLDSPLRSRPHRVYAAITNHCNRACPWCSTCSSPAGRCFLEPETLRGLLPHSCFELQLEGGEPTCHPRLWDHVRMATSHPNCARLAVCTNGARLPRDRRRLRQWMSRLGERWTLKLSVNHHLLERDSGLMDLAALATQVALEGENDHVVVINVRLRPGQDEWVRERIAAAGLEASSNVFYLQRYGYAAGEMGWETPFLVGADFCMVNPDGRVFGPDLFVRSEAMRGLP